MKKSKFTPTQIMNILKEFDLGKSVEEITRNTVFPEQHFTNGGNAMAAWRPVNSSESKSLKRRMQSSSVCMPTLPWNLIQRGIS